MSHTKEVQLSWQPAARREQKQRERYRAAVEKGDRLLPWQREVVKVVEKAEQPVVVVSIPRANGKSLMAARLVARALTPGDSLFCYGGESALVSNTRSQSKFVTTYVRQFLAEKQTNIDKVYSFATAMSGPGSITHKQSKTSVRTFSCNARNVQGIVGARLIIADEVGSWLGSGGLAAWEALETSLGKGETTIFAISTLAPNGLPGSFWYDAVMGEAGNDDSDSVYRFVLSADPDKWDDWQEILRVNPAAYINDRLYRELKTGLKKAQQSERAKRKFLSYRLNIPGIRLAGDSSTNTGINSRNGLGTLEVPNGNGAVSCIGSIGASPLRVTIPAWVGRS